MFAIRGATTVESDDSGSIRKAVSELLQEIVQQNKCREEDMVCMMFSNTADLSSFYPAKAAREAGYSFVPLFSALEPEIQGALSHCIRVMILLNGESVAKHVYLRGAKILRKDISQKLNIALDGPAGSGKSTIAKILADKNHILYLDTGAMYRACALKAIRLGINTKDTIGVEQFIPNIDLKIEYKNGQQCTLLDGEDVSKEIRMPEVAMGASDVAAMKCVRLKMVEMQRKIASQMSCVLDGRDIGSFVLPYAEHKFFVTASPETRAKRRVADLEQLGQIVDYQSVLSQILQRDEQDCKRDFAPLKQAEDAVVVDTSNQTLEESVAYIQQKIQEKI